MGFKLISGRLYRYSSSFYFYFYSVVVVVVVVVIVIILIFSLFIFVSFPKFVLSYAAAIKPVSKTRCTKTRWLDAMYSKNVDMEVTRTLSCEDFVMSVDLLLNGHQRFRFAKHLLIHRNTTSRSCLVSYLSLCSYHFDVLTSALTVHINCTQKSG